MAKTLGFNHAHSCFISSVATKTKEHGGLTCSFYNNIITYSFIT